MIGPLLFACLLLFSPQLAQAQSAPCTGFVDTTSAPTPPFADEHWWFLDLRGNATYSIDVTRSSGICELVVIDVYGGGTVLACDDTSPCTPLVDVSVELDGDIGLTTEYWDISASGSYGHSDQASYSTLVSGDVTVQLFNSAVRVGCGADLSADVTYTIHFYIENFLGDPVTEATWTPNFSFDFLCSSCSLSQSHGG